MASGKPITCKYCKSQFKFDEDEQRKKWRENLYPCPVCQIDYCILPETERELKKLQKIYIDSGRKQKYLNDIAKILYSYVPSLIKRYFTKALYEARRNEGDEALESYSHKTVIYVIENYLKRDDFYISVSFAGYCKDAILWAFREKKERQSNDVSMDFEMDDEGHTVQYADTKLDLLEKIEQDEYRKDIVKTLMAYIKEMKSFCTQREYYVLLIVMNNYLHRGDKYVDKFFHVYNDNVGKLKYMQFLDILKKEIDCLFFE